MNVGIYQTKVSIDSTNEYGDMIGNYKGEVQTILKIKQGNIDATSSFEIYFPSPMLNPSINGHIEYGQTLGEITMTQGSGYVAKYMYKIENAQGNYEYTKRIVEGNFIIADRKYSEDIDASIEDFVLEMTEKIKEVGRYTGSKVMYMCVIPEDKTNFIVCSSNVNITVIKAKPTFENLVISELTYGNISSEITIQGFLKEGDTRPSFTISSIEYDGEKCLNPMANSLPITGVLQYTDRENKMLTAGAQKLSFSFIPYDDINIKTLSTINLDVIVNKAALELETVEGEQLEEGELITRVYGDSFDTPLINVYKYVYGIRTLDNSFKLSYTYTDSQDNLVEMNAFSNAGIYTMNIDVIDNNYFGTLCEQIEIEKADPILNTLPQSSTVTYGMDMSNVQLVNGRMQHPITYRTVNGNFVFKGEAQSPNTVGDVSYDIQFIPNDLQNYNSIDLSFKIRVKKAIAQIQLSDLSFVYSGLIKQPTYTTNIIKRISGDSFSYINLDENGNEFLEGDTYLDVFFSYNTSNGSVPINAGTYAITANINDTYYEGSINEQFVITQANATIIVKEASRLKNFNNGLLSLDYIVKDMNGNTINAMAVQSFKNYDNVQMQENPRDVGFYYVYLELRDTNYIGNASSTLSIAINEIKVSNLHQVYGTKLPIETSQIPFSASSNIYFQEIKTNGLLGDIIDVQPTNAGSYKVFIEYPAEYNNGYTTSREYILDIEKREVLLTYNGNFVYTYSGEKNNQLNSDLNKIRTSPITLYTLNKNKYFYDEDLDEFIEEEPKNVGQYWMKIVIDDYNYCGENDFIYSIEKATPTIKTNPIVQPLIYTDDGTNAVIEGGEVIFNGIVKTGSYSLVENTMNLEVGLHTVKYFFVPDDIQNLNPIYGDVEIAITPKDLSDAIVFAGDTTVQYNAKPHCINASIVSGERVLIEVFYNRSKSAPREKGIYTITANVIDKNYVGFAEWGNKLNIIVGLPVIKAPLLTDINVGERISESEIYGGYAYIDGTGEFIDGELIADTATLIPGTFSFTNPDKIMTEANLRDVEVSFKPFASNNFSNVIFLCKVKVSGQNPIIGNVIVSQKETDKTIYYGQDLSNFNLYFENNPEGATEGILSFEDNSYIPEVGKKVKYKFYPNDDIVYNIIEGEADITINKTTPVVQSISAKAFYGEPVMSAIFNAKLLNQYNSDINVDGEFELTHVDNINDLSAILLPNNVSMGTIPDAQGCTKIYGRYIFISNNYTTIEGDIEISCFHKIEDVNIEITNFSKQYNGMPIIVDDMEIHTASTQHPLYNDNYQIRIYDKYGRESEGTEVGIYTISIEIDDVIYYGKKTVSFEIEKADISQFICLSYTQATYGDAINKPFIVLNNYESNILQENFIIEFKKNTESSDCYNETMPAGAGIYDVRVRVVSNGSYQGEKTLTFTINKKIAQIVVNGTTEFYGRVEPLEVISVEYDLAPTITYYSNTYNRTTRVPSCAGDYIARIEIIDDNYTAKVGSYYFVEVNFKIEQAQLTIQERPIISQIIYGQKYKDINITGGEITYGQDTIVIGKYEFINPDVVPSAGLQTTSIVFLPYNMNFKPLLISNVEVLVEKANAEILFTSISAVYDGTNKQDCLKYVSDSESQWEIIFMQNGNEVLPINAGTYDIKIKILSNNYQLEKDSNGNSIIEKSNVAKFVINKASMESYTNPVPTSISYGQSLASSTLNSDAYFGYGVASYYNIDGFVEGSFHYLNSGMVLGDSGIYTVNIVFVPADRNNYNNFNAQIEVEVIPAFATISVTNNEYIYGTPIAVPTFITNPSNLTVAHNMNCIGDILDCGIYVYRVWITSPNYDNEENYFDFNITIYKKKVGLEFIQN